MKLYLMSLAVGFLVGVIYGALHVRSPAPPVVALVGLLGILVGEQVIPLAKHIMSSERVTLNWFRRESVPHIFGALPTGASAQPQEPES